MSQPGSTTQSGAHEATTSYISVGIVVTGDVACEGNLQISGRVAGAVRGTVVFIDQTGSVEGAVEAEQLRVCGSATGELVVRDLAVEPGGKVEGQISYQRMKVASGGVIQGSISHRPLPESQGEDPPLKLVPSAPTVNPRHVFVD